MSESVLAKYLPNAEAEEFINRWIAPYSVQILIKKGRKSKLGDYRRARKKYDHQITINYDLPKELFFLTLTHEIAHMMVYQQYKFGDVKPHGKEWKNYYGKIIQQSISCYSQDLQKLLLPFSNNPKAGYYGDGKLVEYFTQLQYPNQKLLRNLDIGSVFKLENMPFELLEKRRTRYLCKNLNTKRNYLINYSAKVEI